MTICTIDVHARDVVAKMILAKVFITRRYFCDARHSLLGILAPLSTDFLLFYHFAIFSQYPDSMSKAHMGCQGAWGELGWWRHDWGKTRPGWGSCKASSRSSFAGSCHNPQHGAVHRHMEG